MLETNTEKKRDQYAEVFEIEIDRKGLAKLFRLRHMAGWFFPAWLLGSLLLLGWFFQKDAGFTFWDYLQQGAIRYSIFSLGVLCFASLGYLIFSHKTCKTNAEKVCIKVTGEYLHVIQDQTDRKVHFRSIVDYTVEKCQEKVKTLSMSTTGGGMKVEGVKDIFKVRDMLAEIDAARENRS